MYASEHSKFYISYTIFSDGMLVIIIAANLDR